MLKSAILAILQKEQGWPCPISTGPQKALVGIEKLVLFYVALNPYLESLEGSIRSGWFFSHSNPYSDIVFSHDSLVGVFPAWYLQ